jgi:transposase
VRVLSVDDWAWRKKQRYGTMLMDLERSQVIDLLPERSADSFARWLGLHPEVEVITRDRSSLYADGGRQGASSAVQIRIATTWFPI